MSTAAARHDAGARASARIAVFAALIAALTLVPGFSLLGGAVPVTLQTLGVTLAAALLGPWLGALAVLAYLAMVAVGVPVATQFKGGLPVFTGPTGGFLVGFVPMALVIGALAGLALRRLEGTRLTVALFGAAVAGLPVVYACGVPWLATVLDLPIAEALKQGMVVFLPGDLAKAAVAAVITVGVARALPGLANNDG